MIESGWILLTGEEKDLIVGLLGCRKDALEDACSDGVPLGNDGEEHAMCVVLIDVIAGNVNTQ